MFWHILVTHVKRTVETVSRKQIHLLLEVITVNAMCIVFVKVVM